MLARGERSTCQVNMPVAAACPHDPRRVFAE
jgi:hypothetical protein